MNQDKIGKFIFKLRTEKGLSQYQLADIVPISRQAVSKWERGESIPDSSTLIRLSDIFDVTINELLAGKRLKENSIKELEQTTLTILDERNKKARKIKRNFIISTIIITILLLSFLSYYFISSYNSTKVYMITANGENFKIRDGIYLTTKGKNYLKLGNIEYNGDININNIKLYYKHNNKKQTIREDKDIEKFVLRDLNGYRDILSINKLNNTYIEITYNDNEKETIKLNFKKNYNNSLILRIKNKYDTKLMKNTELIKVSIGIPIGAIGKENKKEEHSQEEIKVVENIDSIKNEMSTKENASETIIHDSVMLETPTPIIKEEKKFDINEIITKLKENSIEFDGTYIYENEDGTIMILYYELLKQLSLYQNDSFMWDYYLEEDRYNCSLKYNEDCKEEIIKNLEEYIN